MTQYRSYFSSAIAALVFAAGAMLPAVNAFAQDKIGSDKAVQNALNEPSFRGSPIKGSLAPEKPLWKANDDDALLFDIRSGKYRLGDGVRGYQTNTGICVDFADMIIALDLPIRLDKKSRRATGWLFNETRTITIDREQNIVQIVNKRKTLSKTDIYDVPEGWCINLEKLSTWLGVELTPDLSNAVIILKSEEKLPFELAEERKERAGRVRPRSNFDISKLPQAKDPYRLWRTPSVDVVASTGVQSGGGIGTTGDARYEIFASGEVAKASFDARISSNDQGAPDSVRVRLYRTDPKGALLGPLKATHVAVGDISTVSTALGAQNTAGRGAFITNRPIERPANFDRTTFRGELPDGWDAELYRNDQLIGFTASRGDGRYEFVDVALLYGQNRFEIILYGPQGQVKKEVKLIPVGLDSIPPKETYYWATVQDNGSDLFNLGEVGSASSDGLRGGFGVERGINAKTSIAASIFTLRSLDQRQNQLELSVRRAIGPTLVEISGANDFGSNNAVRAQVLGQFGQTLFQLEAALLDEGFRSERYNTNTRELVRATLDQNVTIGRKTIPLHFETSYDKDSNGNSSIEALTRTSFNINKLGVTNEFSWEKTNTANGFGLPDLFENTVRLSGRLGKIRLRGEANFVLSGGINGTGFQASQITADWRSGDASAFRAEIGYQAFTRRARVALGYTRNFKNVALTGQIEAASDGSVAAGLNLAFSLGPKPNGGGLRLASNKLASSGQAFATVFHDDNGDGIRQANEAVEKDVELTSGTAGRSDPTNGNGETIVDGLQPFQPILISIDTSTLPDPFVQPANSGVVITPRPGVAFEIALPLVSAGEISGVLVKEGGGLYTGVDLELVDKNEIVIKKTRSEFDGYFLFESVAYGQYKIRINPLVADIIGAQSALNETAVLDKNNPTFDFGTLAAKAKVKIASIKVGAKIDANINNQEIQSADGSKEISESNAAVGGL